MISPHQILSIAIDDRVSAPHPTPRKLLYKNVPKTV